MVGQEGFPMATVRQSQQIPTPADVQRSFFAEDTSFSSPRAPAAVTDATAAAGRHR